jgi:hypothetical protein
MSSNNESGPVFLKKWFLGPAGHVEITMGYYPSRTACVAECAKDGIEFKPDRHVSACGRYVMRDG